MSERVEIGITIDTSEAQMSIEEVQARADEVTKEWRINRNTILRQVREGFTMISSLMSSFRQAMSLMGQQIDPFFSALIGMVLSTASMLISSATTLAMTGIGGAAAAVILGIAISFQILTLGKLLADKLEIKADFSSIHAQMKAMENKARETGPRGPLGGSF